MMRSTPLAAPVVPITSAPSSSETPRVQVIHSPGGTVTIVGVTLAGSWVAEYRCLAEDFDARCVKAMERRVQLKEFQLKAMRTAARVLPFRTHPTSG